jgi:hypothetical protein
LQLSRVIRNYTYTGGAVLSDARMMTMTDRNEIEKLAAKVGADVREDRDGRLSRVIWNGRTYGDGALSSLLCFAERARAA